MAKVLIDIADEFYTEIKDFKNPFPSDLAYNLRMPVANGIVLDNLTNGDVMQKMFPSNRVDIVLGKVYFYTHDDEDEDFDKYVIFDLDWWNRKWGE